MPGGQKIGKRGWWANLNFRDISELLDALQWPARQVKFYHQAVTHSSFAHEEGKSESNERLEFLGDAVLELVISEYFFKCFPSLPEGELTLMCHSVVNEKSLAGIARELQLGSFLRLGKGELSSGGNQKDSILADALEALVGALFLDLGYKKTSEEVVKLFDSLLKVVGKGSAPYVDYKTMLQEKSQSLFEETPAYSIEAESGAPHEKRFLASVKIDDRVVGRGKGKSKKEAEQAAAKEALEKLFLQDELLDRVQKRNNR